jgi:hypothetical protein
MRPAVIAATRASLVEIVGDTDRVPMVIRVSAGSGRETAAARLLRNAVASTRAPWLAVVTTKPASGSYVTVASTGLRPNVAAISWT